MNSEEAQESFDRICAMKVGEEIPMSGNLPMHFFQRFITDNPARDPGGIWWWDDINEVIVRRQ